MGDRGMLRPPRLSNATIVRRMSRLMAAGVLLVLAAGCLAKSHPSTEELRLMTPEQERTLLEQAERVETKRTP